MLPIITAELLISSPNVAIRKERIAKRKKSCLGVLSHIKFSIASLLSFLVRLLKSINMGLFLAT